MVWRPACPATPTCKNPPDSARKRGFNRRTVRERERERVPLICDYNTRSMRIPALSRVGDKKEDLHQIFIAVVPGGLAPQTTADFLLCRWKNKTRE